MTDRPILFSAPMINAMLAGRKTQTRRLIATTSADMAPGQIMLVEGPRFGGTAYRFAPRFTEGDRIYVRETYFQRGHWEPVAGRQTKGGRQKWAFVPADDVILFDAPATYRRGRRNGEVETNAWHQRLGRFMPRAASRLTLIVDAVRVERLQAISGNDAIAEGVEIGWHQRLSAAIDGYRDLWNSLHDKTGERWDDNPFVVAVSFRVVRGNIDQVPA